MKLSYERSPSGRIAAKVSGNLEVDSCTCLENFWELRLSGAQQLAVDLSGIDLIDAGGLASLANLLEQQLESGGHVVLRGARDQLRDALASRLMCEAEVASVALSFEDC